MNSYISNYGCGKIFGFLIYCNTFRKNVVVGYVFKILVYLANMLALRI